jgi:hypothetical protein
MLASLIFWWFLENALIVKGLTKQLSQKCEIEKTKELRSLHIPCPENKKARLAAVPLWKFVFYIKYSGFGEIICKRKSLIGNELFKKWLDRGFEARKRCGHLFVPRGGLYVAGRRFVFSFVSSAVADFTQAYGSKVRSFGAILFLVRLKPCPDTKPHSSEDGLSGPPARTRPASSTRYQRAEAAHATCLLKIDPATPKAMRSDFASV